MDPLLSVRQLSKSFSVRGAAFGSPSRRLQAVKDVSFELFPGETLGLVGESGCGKSTTGKLLLRLLDPDAGEIRFRGEDLARLGPRRLRPLRRHLQMIFQDPYASLNPRMRIGEIIGEPLRLHGLARGAEVGREVRRLLDVVGLAAAHAQRFPHEFSGGQRQRIGIARALAARPQLIVCDEPVSALDLSIQAQIINLLADIQREFALSYLFIAHDLSVIEHISDRVAVMYLGQIVEIAPAAALYQRCRHPYSEALLASVPIPDPTRTRRHVPLAGEIPSPIARPPGCPFHPRCAYARALCRETPPPLEEKAAGHSAACHFSAEVGSAPRP